PRTLFSFTSEQINKQIVTLMGKGDWSSFLLIPLKESKDPISGDSSSITIEGPSPDEQEEYILWQDETGTDLLLLLLLLLSYHQFIYYILLFINMNNNRCSSS